MVVIAYVHDGTSIYDALFLEHLTKHNTVYLLTFNRKLCSASNKTIVVTMREPFNTFLRGREWIEGFRMHVFSFVRSLLLRAHLRLIRPNVVIGCSATTYGFYSALSGFKPFILIVWGSDVLIAPKRFFVWRFMAKISLKKADAVILDSEVQKEAAIQLGCSFDKILKFPWFDLQSVSVRFSKGELKERLGWRNNPIVIITRNHEPIYGVEYFIEAIPYVIEKVPRSRFLILGQGRLSEKLKQRAKQLGIEECVKFLGRVPHQDVASYLSAADVYVSTSLSDGTSASLLEAMTLKVSPVVTDILGNMEWIKNGWNGYLVPVKDPRQLAKKIILLLKDEKLRQQIGERAFETASAKVDWAANSKTLSNLISKLAKGNR